MSSIFKGGEDPLSNVLPWTPSLNPPILYLYVYIFHRTKTQYYGFLYQINLSMQCNQTFQEVNCFMCYYLMGISCLIYNIYIHTWHCPSTAHTLCHQSLRWRINLFTWTSLSDTLGEDLQSVNKWKTSSTILCHEERNINLIISNNNRCANG